MRYYVHRIMGAVAEGSWLDTVLTLVKRRGLSLAGGALSTGGAASDDWVTMLLGIAVGLGNEILQGRHAHKAKKRKRKRSAKKIPPAV